MDFAIQSVSCRSGSFDYQALGGFGAVDLSGIAIANGTNELGFVKPAVLEQTGESPIPMKPREEVMT